MTLCLTTRKSTPFLSLSHLPSDMDVNCLLQANLICHCSEMNLMSRPSSPRLGTSFPTLLSFDLQIRDVKFAPSRFT
jgi:hypothetical protein